MRAPVLILACLLAPLASAQASVPDTVSTPATPPDRSAPPVTVTSAAPVPPPRFTPALPDWPERHRIALELARAVRPSEAIRAELSHLTVDTLAQKFLENPGWATAERAHPGLVAFLAAGMVGPMRSEAEARIPALREAVATLCAGELDTDQMRALIAFWSSPTGVRFRHAVETDSDYAEIYRRMATDGSGVTPALLKEGLAKALPSIVTSLDADDKSSLAQFLSSPAARAQRMLAPRLQRLIADWGNAHTPGEAAKISAIARQRAVEFIAREKHPAPLPALR